MWGLTVESHTHTHTHTQCPACSIHMHSFTHTRDFCKIMCRFWPSKSRDAGCVCFDLMELKCGIIALLRWRQQPSPGDTERLPGLWGYLLHNHLCIVCQCVCVNSKVMFSRFTFSLWMLYLRLPQEGSIQAVLEKIIVKVLYYGSYRLVCTESRHQIQTF